MSFTTNLTKKVIKWTPEKVILWIANIVLKDIAKLTAFSFDLDARKSYMEIQLAGEPETMEVWLEGFVIITEEGSHKLIIEQAHSNRLWLDNILSRIIKKAWKIPVIPEMTSQIEFLAELLKAENPVEEEVD
jgi:hypothetical protein